MKVLIDARWVALAPASSHARYLRALADEWAHLLGHMPASQCRLVLAGPGLSPRDLPTGERIRWLRLPDLPGKLAGRPASRLWANTVFSAAVAMQRPDVLFFPWSSLPEYLFGVPAVVTVHDVCFRSDPDMFPDGGVSGDAQLAHAVRRAAEVLCPSSASAKGVIAAYGIEASRVSVVPHGIARVFTSEPGPTDRATLGKLGIEGEYVLCVSTHEPRKNLDVVVDAFSQHVARGGPGDLVLVGKRSWYTPALVERLERQSWVASQRTHFLNGLSDPELAAVYRQATALLMPSVCEGFGFPIVEALASGTPVVASDLCVFRELAGGDDAAIFLPSDDASVWAEVLGDLSDPRSASLKARAQQHAASVRKNFAWQSSALETLRAFSRAFNVRADVEQKVKVDSCA